ncbi:polysaccharide deacetylase family protein [Paraburkholderia megapolitana]|uniref:Polysaccharide deacetylase n=1 Tax=Paraburkholderia megapolitana TaxID=420953 RepID=A0A1I3DJM6_9BURK|nr:polysaccharide deacetylase [Paraburkholderia megapolitana]QDQ81885.1 polysaccharide deacetylase [Paraburkholderia megapolitana]SFH86873.1 Polysaccharide deacetylase [Paraburkholderia megapolitana]
MNNANGSKTIWPQRARCAVVVTVDFNDDLGILTQEPRIAGREKSLSVWRYGAKRGVDRVLDALDEAGVRSSWFVPGQVVKTHAGLVSEIAACGHELGTSGDRCENFDTLTLNEQRRAFFAGQDALAALTGRRAQGFRSFYGNWAPGFADFIRDEGVTWSSSWRGDDLPYFHPTELPAQTDTPRTAAPLVELPLHYELEDEPYFAYNLSPAVPVGQPRIPSYREVLSNLKQDFAAFHRFGLCFVLRLHPEIIGTAGRIDVLRELLAEMRTHHDVWFATGAEVAEWWRATIARNEPGHPVDVFEQYRQAVA